MQIDFANIEKLDLIVSSYDFHYNRMLNTRRYYGEPVPEDKCASIVFNDTKELDELIYTLCDLRKRIEAGRGHFIDYDKQLVVPLWMKERGM